MTQPDEPLLDKPQACEFLNIGHWHLEKLIRYREIPFRKVGRLVRFDRQELKDWLDENRIEATP